MEEGVMDIVAFALLRYQLHLQGRTFLRNGMVFFSTQDSQFMLIDLARYSSNLIRNMID